ncbi:hypothetical protein BELL_0661g00060 [Botrytis elliptica]|uniref:Uncharacterized protein n=1 Tax=Botrytis elliptica TaxID=278938 RepID=A0A4Z1JAX6_9HELO|nr:hypothetical protein BELL_0661g00060 [Botrytis elliptica]
MSGQDSGDLDWATPSVAQRWVKKIPSLETHRPRQRSRTNEVPDEVPTMIDAPSVSSGNARERFYRDLTRDSWPFPWGQPNNAVHDGTPQTKRRTTRGEHVGEGGSVRGGALARSDEPARGGSHNSEFFTPGGTSQSRGS